MLLKRLQLSSIIQGTIKHDPLRNQAVILIWRGAPQHNLKHLILMIIAESILSGCWLPWFSYNRWLKIIFYWVKIQNPPSEYHSQSKRENCYLLTHLVIFWQFYSRFTNFKCSWKYCNFPPSYKEQSNMIPLGTKPLSSYEKEHHNIISSI